MIDPRVCELEATVEQLRREVDALRAENERLASKVETAMHCGRNVMRHRDSLAVEVRDAMAMSAELLAENQRLRRVVEAARRMANESSFTCTCADFVCNNCRLLSDVLGVLDAAEVKP